MFANINNIRVYFDINGSNYTPHRMKMKTTPVCFVLHGGPGLDHTYFKPWLDPLTQHMQLVYIDLRGNGLSDRPDPETYTLEHMAEDLESLRNYLGLEKISLLGHSFGGFLAQVYATIYPENISKLILITTTSHGGFLTSEEPPDESKFTVKQLEMSPKLFEGKLKDDKELKDWWDIMLPLYFHQTEQEVLDQMIGRTITALEVTNKMYSKNVLPKFDVRDKLKNVEAETLVIAASHDWILPQEHSELICSLIPNATLKLFQNSGHFPFIEETDSFNEEVIKFMNNK